MPIQSVPNLVLALALPWRGRAPIGVRHIRLEPHAVALAAGLPPLVVPSHLWYTAPI